ncbi:GlsB/YeaQ/YmgE family stress response membrane protein [Pseudahrensia aquimaris]|uniref:GlsB/YeaQ/YmgE family stress response membrane protein n=1 Tax=Pseudahrensia aquimaris TaxID=744461 RepID=A0ABW3FE28_9HYPH
MNFIGWIIIGGLAGWLAEKFMKGNYGLLANIGLGILGGVVGGWAFGLIGLETEGFIDTLVTATIGACLCIALYRGFKSRQSR